MARRTKFPFSAWRWTTAAENLFALPTDALETFILFTKEAINDNHHPQP